VARRKVQSHQQTARYVHGADGYSWNCSVISSSMARTTWLDECVHAVEIMEGRAYPPNHNLYNQPISY
tara:strand:- start:406 stop:609 length:204 start_codon:yes stop_codon:yes gene_type:complete